MLRKKILPLFHIVLLACISCIAYAQGTGSIQFTLYSKAEVHQTVPFEVINEETQQESQYYLYEENGYMTTMQLPAGMYHLSGKGVEETPFTVEETGTVKRVYVMFSPEANSQKTTVSSKNTEVSEANQDSKEEKETIESETKQEEGAKQEGNSILLFLKRNAIYFVILIVAFVAFIIVKMNESFE